jgi:hypothetical protein
MTGLITASELGALQEIAELGMVDEVVIATRTISGGLEGDNDVDYTASITVKGWLFEQPASPNGDVVGGVEAIATAYRLYLPVGTPIETGDRVYKDGAEYEVLGINAENTYQPVLRVSLRRAE